MFIEISNFKVNNDYLHVDYVRLNDNFEDEEILTENYPLQEVEAWAIETGKLNTLNMYMEDGEFKEREFEISFSNYIDELDESDVVKFLKTRK